MNYNGLNQMVTYIETHLEEEIDFHYLSKITNTNLFILERIFMFLTNQTIHEYIKKRRLSKAFEEIRNTKCRIIDIAFKYQYNSLSSFNRAFKRVFSITPSECRKKVGSYKVFPIQYFEIKTENYNFDYELKRLEIPFLYCYHVISRNYSEFLDKVKELYKKIKRNGIYEEFNKNGMYGIYYKNKKGYHYYLGSSKYFPHLEKYEIEKKNYVEFKLLSREQKEIVALEQKIKTIWLPSTNYEIESSLKIEFYQKEYCYIYLPIKNYLPISY